MNGLEKITARIEADAQAEAARISEEAALRCKEIRTEGEAKAQETYWRRVKDGVKAAESRVERLGKAAEMEARKSILACKQEIVAEAFDRAEEKLLALPADEYVDFLAAQAAAGSVSGREEILLNVKDREAYGKKVTAKANERLLASGRTAGLTLSRESGDFSGGLILRDGSITVNCTAAALIAEARQSQASAVAAELFE